MEAFAQALACLFVVPALFLIAFHLDRIAHALETDNADRAERKGEAA